MTPEPMSKDDLDQLCNDGATSPYDVRARASSIVQGIKHSMDAPITTSQLIYLIAGVLEEGREGGMAEQRQAFERALQSLGGAG